MEIGAGLAALAFWGFIAAVVVAYYWDNIRKREAQHETLRRMLESGQALDRELMDKLLASTDGGSKNLGRDLKVAGLITLFVAPGIALLGWFIGQVSATVLPILLGVAGLVAFISIGLLVTAVVIERLYREG
jgi:thymidine phosphorylase|tara:strand:+ start:175 stop:570 length:396 start_codon:yes stop_codon:yes gene_type:complete